MKRPNGGNVSADSSTRTQVGQHHYDPAEDAELTTAVVFAIADAMDVAPSALKSPPVYECVDLAALDATFFGSDVTEISRQSVGTVEFEYNAYTVTISSDGWVQIYEPASTTG